MKVYSLKDKIWFKVDKVQFAISPLTTAQKAQIQGMIAQTVKNPTNMLPSIEGSNLCVKYALKELKGVKCADGSAFNLQFENDELTDECVEMINNSDLGTKMHQTCYNLLRGIPDTFMDEYGNVLEGVERVTPKAKKKIQK